MSNINQISTSNLFESIKTFGNYIRTNGLDGKIYLDDLLKFIVKQDETIVVDEIFDDLRWKMNLKIEDSNGNNLEQIYDYVYNVLNMKGEKQDEKNAQNHDTWVKKHIFLRLVSIPKNSPKVKLVDILHIAFYLGELLVELEKDNSIYSEKAVKFLKSNNLFQLDSYVNLSRKEDIIKCDKKIQKLFNLISKYLICTMNQIQLEPNSMKNNKKKSFLYKEDIESFTKENDKYRNVIYTGPNQQFVLMSIKPDDDIKLETHDKNDQYIKVVEGQGIAIVNNETLKITNKSILIIPAGASHYIKNTGSTDLKLYTIYSPKEHEDGLIQETNPEKTNLEKTNLEKTNLKKTNLEKTNLEKTNPEKNSTEEMTMMGGNFANEKDYKMKYLYYKNKYLTIKQFMKEYYH
jgi:mannose-6-phosphate isomerase-like protein (cupin superfamily)